MFPVTYKSQHKNVFCFKSCIKVLFSPKCVCGLFSKDWWQRETERNHQMSPPKKNHSYKEQDLSGGIEMWQAGETNNSAKTMIWQHDCQGQFN